MEAHIYDIASNVGRVLLNPFLLTMPVIGALALVTGLAGRVAISIEDLRYMWTQRSHATSAPMTQRAPSVRHRAEGEMTDERIEPRRNRPDEIAHPLHVVQENPGVIDVSGFRVDPAAAEEVLNRRPRVA